MEGLAPVDGWAVAAILAKAAGYAAALLAMGGPLFLAAFSHAEADVRRLARQVAVAAAFVGIAVLALRFGIRAARISGMGASGAFDPMMLGFVWDSPLGWAAIWQTGGFLLVAALVFGNSLGLGAGLLGTALIAMSFSTVGHSHGDPRWLLASLLTVHVICAAFWVGSLVPLHRAASEPAGGEVLHRFGYLASYSVGLLLVAGLGFAIFVSGSVTELVTTAYGWILLGKIGVVGSLMLLAALNKWRFVPALKSGSAEAVRHLKTSIRLEGFAVAVILLLTATLTSITTPPVNL